MAAICLENTENSTTNILNFIYPLWLILYSYWFPSQFLPWFMTFHKNFRIRTCIQKPPNNLVIYCHEKCNTSELKFMNQIFNKVSAEKKSYYYADIWHKNKLVLSHGIYGNDSTNQSAQTCSIGCCGLFWIKVARLWFLIEWL